MGRRSAASSDFDHGELQGLLDDDHPQYSLVDGTRPFTGPVGGQDPVVASDLATKNYVDDLLAKLALLEYYLTDTASDIGSTYRMQNTPTGQAMSSWSTGAIGVTTLITAFATPSGEPALSELKDGLYGLHIHAAVDATVGNKTAQLNFKLYKYPVGGPASLIGTSENSSALTTSISPVEIHYVVSAPVTLDPTDRILIEVYAAISGSGANPTVTIYAEGGYGSSFALAADATAISHSVLANLGADDHPQYALADGTRGPFWVPIAEVVLGSDAASITFDNIPGTFRSLVLKGFATTDYAAAGSDFLSIKFNDDGAANYAIQYLYANGTNTGANSYASSGVSWLGPVSSEQVSTAFMSGITSFFDGYAIAGEQKSFYTVGATVTNVISSTSAISFVFTGGQWSGTAAITKMTIAPVSGTVIRAGAVFTLYGIPAA